MKTSTHVHLRLTNSDPYMSHPIRLMEDEKWDRYFRWMLVMNGFDLTRPIFQTGAVPGFDVVFSQELESEA